MNIMYNKTLFRNTIKILGSYRINCTKS